MQATLIAAAEHLEAVLPAEDVLRELVTDKGFHSNDRLVDLAAIGTALTSRNQTAVGDDGGISPRRARRSTPTAGGSADRGACVCCVAAASCSNGRPRTRTTPAG